MLEKASISKNIFKQTDVNDDKLNTNQIQEKMQNLLKTNLQKVDKNNIENLERLEFHMNNSITSLSQKVR